MRLIVHTEPTPAEDLALEEALQRAMETASADGGAPEPVWRLWQAARPAVILGTGQEHAREVNLDAARAEGLAVLRRHSGGGAVLIGPGAINYSAFYRFVDLPGSETITGAMEAALQAVVAALKGLGLDTRFAGLSDLAVADPGGDLRKIAGHSQARKRHTVLVHGTLLADPDWARLARVLTFPSRSPDYRAGRDHRAFLTSLAEHQAPADLGTFAAALGGVLGVAPAHEPPAQPVKDLARQLLQEKYRQDAWHLRR